MKTRWKALLAVLAVFVLCSATLLLSAISLDNYHYPNAQRIDDCGSTDVYRNLGLYIFSYSNCYNVEADRDVVDKWYKSAGWIHSGKGGLPNVRVDLGSYCYQFLKVYLINSNQGNILDLRHYFLIQIGLCN